MIKPVCKIIGTFAALILGSSCLLHAQERQSTYRNGQRFTEYPYPLKGDVEYMEIIDIYINPDNGKEYPRDTTIIKFNKNGDVCLIDPYVNTRYSDIVFPTSLHFIYNDSGQHTNTMKIVEYDDYEARYTAQYTYDRDERRLGGEWINDKGEQYAKEEYIYDEHGNLSCEKYYRGGSLDLVYFYDNNMNIIEIEEYTTTEYPNVRMWFKTYRTYDQEGRILKETAYWVNKQNEFKLYATSIFTYDENGFLNSKETRSPFDESIIKYSKDSRTEAVERSTFKCDSHGNVIEKLFYPDGSEYPKRKYKYIITY